jgi:Zn-finger nucleic acid-binding protein
MKTEAGAVCSACLCPMQASREYGEDVRCCPQCGFLWLGERGVGLLIGRMQKHRLSRELRWEEFVGQVRPKLQRQCRP